MFSEYKQQISIFQELGRPVINHPYALAPSTTRRVLNSAFKDSGIDPARMASYSRKEVEFQKDAAGLLPRWIEPKQMFKPEVQMSHFCVVQHQQFKEPQSFKRFMIAKNLYDVLPLINWGVRND